MGIHTAFQTALDILRKSIGCHGNNRQIIAIFIAALVLLLGIYSAGFIENRIVEESVSHLEEIYSQINASFSVLVFNNWNMLDDWKYHIGHAVDESEEKLHEFLQNRLLVEGFNVQRLF